MGKHNKPHIEAFERMYHHVVTQTSGQNPAHVLQGNRTTNPWRKWLDDEARKLFDAGAPRCVLGSYQTSFWICFAQSAPNFNPHAHSRNWCYYQERGY